MSIDNYLKSKKRLILLVAINIFMLYNTISQEGDSKVLSLLLMPMAILALYDVINRRNNGKPCNNEKR